MTEILTGLSVLFGRRRTADDVARREVRAFAEALRRLDRPLPRPAETRGGRVRALGPLFTPRGRP